MTLYQFLNGIRILWNIPRAQYLSCINQEDREFVGDDELWKNFARDAHKTFSGLPEQDQRRIFALIEDRNTKAGIGT